jgi:hypothetical protein
VANSLLPDWVIRHVPPLFNKDDSMPNSLDQIVNNLRKEMATWTSVEIRVHGDQHFEVPPPGLDDPYVSLDDHYIETALGQRLLESVYTTKSGHKKKVANYTDGERCARVFYDDSTEHQTRIGISKDFASEAHFSGPVCPSPLAMYYVGKAPLYKALPDGKNLGAERVLDRDCDVFLFSNVNIHLPEDAVYYLDSATSVPLRVDYFKAGSREDKDLHSSWQARSLDEVDGHHVPLVSEIQYYVRGEGLGHLSKSVTDTATEVHFDRAYPASTFWPKYEPGVKVNDTLKHKVIQVPGPKHEINTMTLDADKIVVSPSPVGQPGGWTPWLSGAGLLVGIALIASALVLRRSRS